MSRIAIVKFLSILIVIIGSGGAVGLIFGISFLKVLSPNLENMRFTAALCFALSGMILFFIAKIANGKTEVAQVVLSILFSSVLIFSVNLLLSFFLGVSAGAEDFLAGEWAGMSQATNLGLFSWAAVLNFILIAAAGFLAIASASHPNRLVFFIGCAIIAVEAVTLFGFLVLHRISWMSLVINFYGIVLFIAIGLGLILVERIIPKEN